MFSSEDLQVFEMPLRWERNDALGKVFHPKLAAMQFKINELIRQVYGIEVHERRPVSETWRYADSGSLLGERKEAIHS